jgi:putative cell wall-binding protein
MTNSQEPIKSIPIYAFKTNHRFHIARFQNGDEWDSSFALELVPDHRVESIYSLPLSGPKIKCSSANKKNFHYIGKMVELETEKYVSFKYKNGSFQAVPISGRFNFNKIHQDNADIHTENVILGKNEKTINKLQSILRNNRRLPVAHVEEEVEEDEKVSNPEEKEEEEELKTKKRAPKKVAKKQVEEEEENNSDSEQSSKNPSGDEEPLKFGKGATQLSEAGKKLHEILKKTEDIDIEDDDEELFGDEEMYEQPNISDISSLSEEEEKRPADPRPLKVPKKEDN